MPARPGTSSSENWIATDCALCERLRHVVERGEFWTLALNLNQNLPGRCVLVLNRHCERVSELTTEEWAALHPYIARITAALDGMFAPDLYNFAFLMNFDAHVHLHVVPRYAFPREWRGEIYNDPHYGSLFGREKRLTPDETLEALADTIRERLSSSTTVMRANIQTEERWNASR